MFFSCFTPSHNIPNIMTLTINPNLQKKKKTVAISKHGSILLRNRNPLQIPLLPRFRRLHPRLPLLQPHRHNPRLLLLDLRPQIRSATNGALAFLVRLVGSQTDRHLQRFSLYRMVLCKFHCGRGITAYGKSRRTGFRRDSDYCDLYIWGVYIWIQSCSRI